MGDPLSVAASVAGLISLGISTIQGLVDYYQAYRSQNSTINRLAQRLSNLLGTLQSLDATLKKRILRAGEEAVVSQVESSVQSCEDIIDELRSQLDKLQLAPKHEFTAAAVNFGKKVTYPFKSSTLLKLDEDVGEFRENLSLALSVLQLHDNSVAQKDFEQLQSLLALVRTSQLSDSLQTWLNAPDPTVNQNAHWAKRHPSTGLWLLQSPVFTSWLTSPGSSLWLTGFAGTGKSVLCSSVIQEIFQHRACDAAIAIAFYYFTFTDSAKQDLTGLLKSLVVQIASQQRNGNAELSELQKNYPTTPSDQALADYLFKQVAQFEHTYIVIDALDEVPKKSRKNVFTALAKFQSWSECNLHLLFTSRDLVEIRDVVVPFAQEIPMNVAVIDEDIANFVSSHLQTDPALAHLADFHEEIKTSLTSRAKGVFRWVECQLDVLADCPKSRTLVRELLRTLPATLDETYSRMLGNINVTLRKTARRILNLLRAAIRPLTADEICCAIAVELGEEPRYDEDAVLKDEHDILHLCPGLVLVDYVKLYTVVNDWRYEKDDSFEDKIIPVVRLAHFSVLEYLRSDRIRDDKNAAYFVVTDPEVDAEMVFTCLVYLMTLRPRRSGIDVTYTTSEIDAELEVLIPARVFGEPRYESCFEILITRFPFFKYAADNWTRHYRQCCGERPGRMDTIVQQFMSDAAALRRWCIFSLWREDGTASSLYYASLEGLTQFVVYCFEAAKATSYDKISKNGLSLSVSMLVNQESGEHKFALHAAIEHGYKEIVLLLLENGADVHATNISGSTALEVSAWRGHLDFVALLLENGADVNATNVYGITPLGAACTNGYADIVALLLKKGADVNNTDEARATVLEAASCKGYADIVALLLENGADVNATDSNGTTALHGASRSGRAEIVALLLEKGAHVSIADHDGATALHYASRSGEADIVALLLGKGADINATSRDELTALHRASAGGHADTVALLLEKGADSNFKGGRGISALCLASFFGHADTVALLLEKGMNINPQGGEHYHALIAACEEGHNEVAQLLLEKGADVNVWVKNDSSYLKTATPLHGASRSGSLELVQLLIANGADVERYGCKALRIAKAEKHTKIVQYLLSCGAKDV